MNRIFLGVAAAALIAITATPSFAQRERGWQGEITGQNGNTVFIDRDVSAGGGQRFGNTAITGPGGGTTTIDHVGMHGGGAGHGSTVITGPQGNAWTRDTHWQQTDDGVHVDRHITGPGGGTGGWSGDFYRD
ncbi:MAG: hypothetical protein KDA49_07490 [Rhodospirillaceae bacterium]|nr:hypothetical protein [Rhodospirillaceae bacterium]MCA8932297.1 hypothetical protein [Rhodospirillaceae bacterium]